MNFAHIGSYPLTDTIPYAAPPVGENRWKRPQPVISWEGVKDCKNFGNSAMQDPNEQEVKPNSRDTAEFLVSSKTFSEDCLNLNVWAKGGETQKDKPVLVYVHGGAFGAGGSSCEIYDGQNIAKEDVVYVSINYRLGIFGWYASDELAAEDPDGSTGNYGLMDIIKSLEWVKANISAFGGDGNNITLMGQSAGSNLVQNVMVSPKAQGLVKNVVACSYNMVGSEPGPATQRAALYKQFCGSANELRSLTAEELQQRYIQGIMTGGLGFAFGSLGVCNDGAYVNQSMMTAIEKGVASNVNLLTGMVFDNENNFNTDKQFAPNVTGLNSGEALMAQLTRLVNARKKGNATGTSYIYDYAFPMSGPNKNSHGAFHSSDIPYFLNYRTPLRADYWTDDDVQVGKTLSSYLVNFCKTGNPNGENLTTWEPNTGNYKYMWLDKVCEMKTLSETQIKAYENAIK